MENNLSRRRARQCVIVGSAVFSLAGTLVPAASAATSESAPVATAQAVKPKRHNKTKGAEELKVPDGLRRKLGDLYFAKASREWGDIKRNDIVGPIRLHYGKVREGKSGVAFYAIGDTGVFGELINPRVLPHVWRKAGKNGKWVYVGATPNGLCAPGRVPKPLARAWGVGCS